MHRKRGCKGMLVRPVVWRRSAIVAGVASLLLLGCDLFPEASFELAPESRLPMWFTLPPRLSRSDVSVTMTYYVKSSGRTSKFVLFDAKKRELAEVRGTQKGLEPIKLHNASSETSSGYPQYEIVTANGVVEVIEHRRMEPLFYITDDTDVLSELGIKRARVELNLHEPLEISHPASN